MKEECTGVPRSRLVNHNTNKTTDEYDVLADT